MGIGGGTGLCALGLAGLGQGTATLLLWVLGGSFCVGSSPDTTLDSRPAPDGSLAPQTRTLFIFIIYLVYFIIVMESDSSVGHTFQELSGNGCQPETVACLCIFHLWPVSSPTSFEDLRP